MSDSITSTASELAKAEGFSPEDINAIAQSEQAASEAGTAVNPSISDDNQGENAPEIGQAFAELAQKKGFKSVDDLVNAYVNMESQGTRTQQELKEIRKEISSLRAPSQPEDPYKDLPPEQKQALGLLEGVVSRIIEQKIRPLQEDVETRNAGKQIEAIRSQYPHVSDADLGSALDIMEERPGLTLGDAVKLATYDKVREASQIQQNRTAQAQQKTRSFVESSKTSRSGDIDYSKLSLEELEAILPKSGQFIDSKGVLQQ